MKARALAAVRGEATFVAAELRRFAIDWIRTLITTRNAMAGATLYRMVLPDHTCPFGVRAKALLEGAGFDVEDRVLGSREDVEAFKAGQGVETTPQIFINDEWIGGCDDLQSHLVKMARRSPHARE